VLVDGSEPDPLEAPGTLGVLSLPRTALGDGRLDWAAFDGDTDGMGDTDEPSAIEAGTPPTGLRAIDPLDDVATTAMPSTRTPATARIGTRANRLPSGSGSRQFGQKPETGVVT